MALYINGEQIKNYKEVTGLTMDEDSLAFDLPGHVLIDEKAMTKWTGNIYSDDAEALANLLRIDCDGFAGKRVRVYIQSIGPIPREGR